MTTPTLPLADTPVIEFFVAGVPAPQGSKKAMPIRNKKGELVRINQLESSKKVGPWRDQVATASRTAMGGRPPLGGPARARLEFVLYRPKTTPKSKATPPAIKYPDVDKLTRAVFDGMGGVVVANDSQIIDVHATKRLAEIGEATGVYVRVEAMT
ncbi:RusA-like resolvase [Mycobacterium phage Sejanus]|nr:RusA-like resolvase [Mycobacterium phage Sejanus]